VVIRLNNRSASIAVFAPQAISEVSRVSFANFFATIAEKVVSKKTRLAERRVFYVVSLMFSESHSAIIAENV
jgi:hypothetical protein